MFVFRWLRNTLLVVLLVVLAGLIFLTIQVASANDLSAAYPVPTGPYPVGVHDFEFVDTVYPVDREQDAEGRRLMVRVWYPAAGASGERRPYFETGEYEAVGQPMLEALPMLFPDTLFDPFRELLTHSYVDAPINDELDALPTIVYSLGALSFVHQSTALMEELASHGYLVFGVTHPGGASGVLYPNGDSVRFDDDFHAGILALFAPDEACTVPMWACATRPEPPAGSMTMAWVLGCLAGVMTTSRWWISSKRKRAKVCSGASSPKRT